MTMLKIVQHNLNHSRLASHQLRELCRAETVDMALLQEPLISSGKVYAFESCAQIHAGTNAKAAIII